jgi:hypothetical protein
MIDPRDRPDPEEFETLSRVFREQLVACLEECAQGRTGLFMEAVNEEDGWPEAARLRELAVALQGVLSAHGERDALCDEFLDLCSMHGEFDPGERRLARAFLERLESGKVGTPGENGKKPW